MCGTFTRGLRQAPAGLIEQIKALQCHPQLQFDGLCATFDYSFPLEQQQIAGSKKDNFESLVLPEASDLNWAFLDEAAIPDIDEAAPAFSTPLAPMPVSAIPMSAPEVPLFFSGPEDVLASPAVQQCGWSSVGSDCGAETSMPSASSFVALAAPSFRNSEQWTTASFAPRNNLPLNEPVLKHEPHSESSDHDSHMPNIGHSTEDEDGGCGRKPCGKGRGKGKGKACAEQLPETLINHPVAATLLSAGIRIKGRSEEELLQVADRVKKRRRQSAARCRARRANHIHVLEDENGDLKAENARLKQRISELTHADTGLAAQVDAEMLQIR